jgi:hypothetical protein
VLLVNVCKFEVLGKTVAVNTLILGIAKKVLCFIVKHGVNNSGFILMPFGIQRAGNKLICTHSL